MHARTHVCMYACMYACTYACMHVCMHAYVHVSCMQTCMHAIMLMHAWACMRMPESVLCTGMACIMHAHAKKIQTNWAAKATVFMCMRKACAHASKWTSRIPGRSCWKENHDINYATTKKLLCMRKHDGMPYHAMPWRAHATCYARHVCMRYDKSNMLGAIRIVVLS